MTDRTISLLFEYGKKVYNNELNINTAAQQACIDNNDVAESSAKHYILWYSKMRKGEYLTWNSNSDLLLYYARKIIEENGKDAGQLAISSAIKFAQHVSRTELEDSLHNLADEKGIKLEIPNNKLDKQKESFKSWLKNNKYHKYTDHVIYKYIRALEMAEEWLSIKLPVSIFSITKFDDFEKCEKHIKEVPNFTDINKKHGHGDLSAALSQYSMFITDQTTNHQTHTPVLPSTENSGEQTMTAVDKNNSEDYPQIPAAPPISQPHNRIVFGAPGTGKSYRLNNDSKEYFTEKTIERVTFHPNYSYAQFVGTYKPVQDTDDEKQISYQYVPGPFMRVYAAAKQNQNQNFLLIVEEINRANVAAVFGDIFQLLDREDGVSEYPVAASEDIKKYLKQNGIDEDKLSIPSNMYIWATMNSADQGVFPMDTAFKRRWEFEYIGIDENEEEVKEYWIPINDRQKVKWNDLRKAINKKLISMKINEDKLLGPFFLSRTVLENAMEDGEKFIRLFKSKVLMYLFEDAAKMKPAELFDVQERIFSGICNEFDEKGTKVFKLDAEVEVLDIEESNSIEEEQEEPQE